MTRIKRLEPVVKHADKKQQQALTEMASSQVKLELENTKLEQLKVYKSEYQAKQSIKNSLCSALDLQEFNRFLTQLDQTIDRQKEIVQMRDRELDGKRKSWQTSRVDSKKIHKVVENLQQQEYIQEARNEIKTMDEFTQIKFQKS